jgi:Holliday junction resolvasome RuvABC endonuclease subunit
VATWGIDPASKKIAMFSDDKGLIKANKLSVPRTDRNTELLVLRHWMQQVLEFDRDPVIFCEEPVVAGARNLRSTILVAETVGVVLALDARVVLVPVSSWKKRTVGRGNATKDEVSDWLKNEHPLYASHCRGDQDLTDAAAIYLYGRYLDVRP